MFTCVLVCVDGGVGGLRSEMVAWVFPKLLLLHRAFVFCGVWCGCPGVVCCTQSSVCAVLSPLCTRRGRLAPVVPVQGPRGQGTGSPRGTPTLVPQE